MDLNAASPDSCVPINPRLALILFLAVLLLSLPQAALLPLLDRDEPRFAEASREMLQSGNFVVPTFNGTPRYAKPPLIYWCQAVSFTIFGENAFAARLPSLLATAATAVLLLTWGTRLGSAQMGVGAGLAYAFCFQTMQQGRVATADALLIFCMTLTAFTGWLILRPREAGGVRLICFGVLALGFAGGFLAKGPEALLPFLPLLWCARKSGRAIVTGIVISFISGLALILIWAIPAYIQTNGEYWRQGLSEGVGQRMVAGLQGHGASSLGWYLLSVPFYYPLWFLLGGLPWWPLAVIHRKKLFNAWKIDLTDTYLLLNAGLIAVIFSLMVTKLPHYTLPAFPFLALALARRWHAVDLPECSLPKLGWTTGDVFALLAFILIPIAMVKHAMPSPVGELVRTAGADLKPDTQFALVDFQEPSAIWEMRRVVKSNAKVIPESDILSFLIQPGPRAIVLSTETWNKNSLIVGAQPLLPRSEAGNIQTSWSVLKAHGFNAAKGSFIDLTLVVKP